MYTLLRRHPHYKWVALDYIALAVSSSHCLNEGTSPLLMPWEAGSTRLVMQRSGCRGRLEETFAGVRRLRHVSVELDIRLIGAEAWQNCRQLHIVKLPATVVGISDNVFRDCKQLNSVLGFWLPRLWIQGLRGMLFLAMGACI